MLKKENLEFKKIINENGVPITNCYFIDTPENILATMVEDAPKDFKDFCKNANLSIIEIKKFKSYHKISIKRN